MNKMNNLEELFSKYEVFMKYGNKNNYMKNKEVEIKIDNGEECNCELCQNEKACIKKISEMNKSSNIDVNVESIMIEAQNPPEIKKKENDTEKYQTNNYYISFEGKNKSGQFSKSKTLHSFESPLLLSFTTQYPFFLTEIVINLSFLIFLIRPKLLTS